MYNVLKYKQHQIQSSLLSFSRGPYPKTGEGVSHYRIQPPLPLLAQGGEPYLLLSLSSRALLRREPKRASVAVRDLSGILKRSLPEVEMTNSSGYRI